MTLLVVPNKDNMPKRRKSKVRFRCYKSGPPGFNKFLDLNKDITIPIIPTTTLIISTPDIQMTLRKIEDNTTVPIEIYGEEDFIHHKMNVEMMSSDKKNFSPLLICKAKKAAKVVKDFFEISEEEVKDGQQKTKLIIVTGEEYEVILRKVEKMVKGEFLETGNILVENDSVTWDDLGESMKQEVFQRRIVVQKNETNLKDFLKTNDAFKEAPAFLSGQLLLDLINDKIPIILNDWVPLLNEKEIYVGRKVAQRSQISPKIFQNSGQDLFLFTGIQKEQLISKYITGGKTYSTGENLAIDGNLPLQTSTMGVLKFRILSRRNEFDEISEKISRPVHHLHYNDGIFTWVKSKGSLATIQDAVEVCQNNFDENDPNFLSHFESNQLTIINADGGCGKTKFIQNIGRKLQAAQNSHDFVFYIRMSQLASKMRERHGSQFTAEDVVTVIIEVLNFTDFEHEIIKEIIKQNTSKVHLLLDAFDQVEQTDVRIAMKCLKRIRQQYQPSIRVWITLRPHVLRMLENSLESLIYSYELQPLDTSQQAQMLVSHWVHENDDFNEDRKQTLEEYGKKCLQFINDKGWDTLKLPEHCQLIANVLQNDDTLNSSIRLDAGIGVTLSATSLVDFYRIQVDKIINNYQNSNAEKTLTKKDMMSQLIFEAIELHLPKWEKPFQKLLKKQYQTTALVDSNTAPFFISIFIVEVILKQGSNIIEESKHEFLFTEFLWNNLECFEVRKQVGSHVMLSYEFKYPIIVHILNDMIANLSHFDQSIIECLQDTITSHRLKQLATACASSNFTNLLQWILARRPFDEHDYNVFDEQLLFTAASNSNVELLGNLLGKFEEFRGKVVVRDIALMPGVSLLQVAVTRGDLSIVEYLLGPHDFQQLIRTGEPNHKLEHYRLPKSCRGLLHLVLTNSFNNPTGVIDQKREIIRKLLQINTELISEKDKQGCKPIVSPLAHVDLLIELITLGADVLAGNEIGETILHIAAGYMSPSDYDKLLHAIPLSTIGGLLKSRPDIKRTPLHSILQHFDPLETTILKYMKHDGIDVNAVDENGENIVEIALKMSRSSECLNMILAHATKTLT